MCKAVSAQDGLVVDLLASGPGIALLPVRLWKKYFRGQGRDRVRDRGQIVQLKKMALKVSTQSLRVSREVAAAWTRTLEVGWLRQQQKLLLLLLLLHPLQLLVPQWWQRLSPFLSAPLLPLLQLLQDRRRA